MATVLTRPPSRLPARAAAAAGLIQAPADFPLLVNDRWSIGIILTYVWKEIPFITLMLLAVLHRHGGVSLGDQDVFANVVGGIDAWSKEIDSTVPTYSGYK